METVFPYLGMLLQWARAQKRFSEWYYAGIVVVAAFVMYAWATPGWTSQDWRMVLAGLWGHMTSLLAMTQATSTGANLAAKWLNPASVAVPVTDSK